MPFKEKDKSCIQRFKIPEKYLVSYDTDRKYTWDILVLALAVYSAFIIPLSLSF